MNADSKGVMMELAELENDPQLNVPEPFVVHDEASANWLIRKIIELRGYRDRVDEWAAREKARATHDEDFLMMRFGPSLRDWASQQISHLKGRRKSIGLPAGTIGFRRSAARLVIDDDGAVIDWAKQNCPSAVETVFKLSRTAIKEFFEKSGEIPTGAYFQAETNEFFIR